MNSYKLIPAVIMAMCFHAAKGYAQKEVAYTPQIVLDKQVKAGDLTLFPQLGSPDKFFYLPNQPRLKMREDGTPVLSFLRYVKNGLNGKETDQGGVLHLLFGIEVTDDQLAEAKKELRKIIPEAVIVGPVIYRSGTVEIVTSEPADKTKKRVCGVGSAPVMDGDYIAVSIRLLEEETKIMWESFKSPVPDISFNFNMILAGYNSPIKADGTMNYDKIYEHKIFSGGLSMSILQADIQHAVQDMYSNKAIEINWHGYDEGLEKIIDRLIEMFKEEFCIPIGAPGGPNFGELAKAPDQEREMLKRATDQYNKNREAQEIKATTPTGKTGDSSTLKDNQVKNQTQPNTPDKFGGQYKDIIAATPPELDKKVSAKDTEDKKQSSSGSNIAVAISYQMKKIRMQGKNTFSLTKSLATTINTTFGGNVGQIDCPECFREINLDDPMLTTKEVYVTIDGMNASDFGNYINSVNFQLRKTHQSGEIDIKEIVINRSEFNQSGNNAMIWYGWKGDSNVDLFHQYEYRVHWSFFGGYNLNDAEWHRSSEGKINLTPPYQRNSIEVILQDQEKLLQHNVAAVEARVYYKLGDREMFRRLTFDLRKQITSGSIDFILPLDQYSYEYEFIFLLKGNIEKSTGRKQATSRNIYISETELN